MTAAVLWGSMGTDSHSPDTALEQATGKRQSLVHLALPWANGRSIAPAGPNYQSFPQTMPQSAWDRGSLVLLDWASWDLSNQSDPAFALDRVIAGDHDPFIHRWAKDAAAWGKAFMLRFDAEMNGEWEPYGGTPEKFVQAWRHVVDIFRSEGAKNVAWHWCPSVTAPIGTPYTTAADKLALYYPGDDYVDWTGFDTYNWFTGNGGPWMTFDQIMNGYPGWLGPTYDTIAKIAPSKPMCIGEFGCWDDARKPAWLTDALSTLPTKYPLVRAISYFNWPADNATWPLSGASLTAFAKAIANPVYVTGGQMEMPSAKITPYEVRLPRPQPSNPDVPFEEYTKVVDDGLAATAELQNLQQLVRQWRGAQTALGDAVSDVQ